MRHMSLWTGLIAASLASTVQAAPRDTLTIGVAQFPASLNPYISSQTVQYYTDGFGLRPISAFDTAGAPVCLLCTTLPTLENGLARREDLGDGKTGLAVTIKLKPDLKWDDGQKVTAADILFTWKLGSDPKAGFASNYTWTRAKSVDVVDDETAVLHLDQTYVSYQLWDYVLPEHIEKNALGANALDYINHTTYNAAPMTRGLWNGPYRISGYYSGDRVEFEPNPYWAGEKPAFKHIVLRAIENTAALQANLLSGDVDMSVSGIGITTDQAVSLETAHPGMFNMIYKPGLSYERITFNQSNKPLADLRIRKALLLGIDRKALVDRLFAGHATLALDWVNEVEPRFTTDVTTYKFDPAAGRALIKEAGYTPGPDGVCTNAAGDRLSFEFATTSGNRIRELSQQVLQNQWKTMCIEVTIHNQPSRTFFGELMRKRQFTGLAEYANSMRINLVPLLFYGTDAVPTEANNFTGSNWTGAGTPEMDAAMKEAATELDVAKQKVLWAKMQQIYTATLPELPLYFRQDPDIIPVWMKGYEATGKEDYNSFWAEKWRP